MAIQEVYWTLLGIERVWRLLVDKALANGIVGLESFFCRAGATRIDVGRLGEDRAGAM